MRTLILATASAVALGFAGAAPGFAAENTATTPGATITQPATPSGAKTITPDTGTTNSSMPQTGATTPQPAISTPGSNAENSSPGMRQDNAGMTNPSSAAAATMPATPSEVREAQQKLHREGLYRGRIDGRMGPETQQALRHYQQQNGLEVTARLDHQTMNSLLGSGAGQGSSMPNSPMPSSGAGTSGSSPGGPGGMNPANSTK
ncbi:MAG TPA: peptidoglycan-binding protein [Stellaceae bacterium]|nr:peptidoglycan-binding protein [Stellaceae bacterium]